MLFQVKVLGRHSVLISICGILIIVSREKFVHWPNETGCSTPGVRGYGQGPPDTNEIMGIGVKLDINSVLIGWEESLCEIEENRMLCRYVGM